MNTAEKLAREVLEAFATGDVERVGELVTEDFVDHGAPPWAPQGRVGYVRILRFLTETLHLRYELHDVVAAGDKVAVRATAHGVHRPTAPPTTHDGLKAVPLDHLGFPATGRPYAMPTMHLYRASGGLLAEHWGVRDELSVLWQVGALPAPEPVDLPG